MKAPEGGQQSRVSHAYPTAPAGNGTALRGPPPKAVRNAG